jgi:protein AroM
MNGRPILGLVTIGQTPRPDLVEAFAREARHAEVRIAGALDGLTGDEVAGLTAPGDYPLLVRLASGATAVIPRDRLVARVESCARTLASGGARLVVVACAGAFPAVACAVPVVIPGRVVPAVVASMTAGARVGVVTPNAGQMAFAEGKWRLDGFDVGVTHAAPGRGDELARAASFFRDEAPALVVLDCMGHSEAERIELARLSGCPVLAVQSLVARLAAAMV